MIDLIYPAVTVGLGGIVASTSYLVRRVLDTDKILTTHLKEDDVRFQAFKDTMTAQEKVADERHTDLKDRLVRIEGKLDNAKVVLEMKAAREYHA